MPHDFPVQAKIGGKSLQLGFDPSGSGDMECKGGVDGGESLEDSGMPLVFVELLRHDYVSGRRRADFRRADLLGGEDGLDLFFVEIW